MDHTNHPRRIRSFVLRQGRLTSGQAQALDRYWCDYGVDFSSSRLDLDKLFGRSAPRVLDIGAGMGDNTLTLAQRHPENDYLAVEVHRPGVGSLVRQAAELRLTNVRVICHDIIEILQQQLPDRCLDEVYLFFPDPWPKRRHHKRRLLSPHFLSLLKPKLKEHARLYLATDWEDLALYMLNVCDSDNGLRNLAGKGLFTPRARWRPLTRFEQRGERLEYGIRDLVYVLKR